MANTRVQGVYFVNSFSFSFDEMPLASFLAQLCGHEGIPPHGYCPAPGPHLELPPPALPPPGRRRLDQFAEGGQRVLALTDAGGREARVGGAAVAKREVGIFKSQRVNEQLF